MEEIPQNYADWNPWHGCTKISAGCKHCYVYRQDALYENPQASSTCTKNATFSFPLQKKRDGSYKLPYHSFVYTCFTSDFLLEDADEWRSACWKMMRERQDCTFLFFTKRIDRFLQCIPDDWGDGYENVSVGCTVENQDRADYRLPIFLSLPIRRKLIIVAPILEKIDLSAYLTDQIAEVSVGGESGTDARKCDFAWILELRRQCVENKIPFCFHQTGAHFVKDGKQYTIARKLQHEQARKANVDYNPYDDKRLF